MGAGASVYIRLGDVEMIERCAGFRGERGTLPVDDWKASAFSIILV